MHMGEHGTLRLHPRDPRKRFLDGEVARMRRIAECINDPDIEALKMLERLLWEIAHIGRVGDVAEAEAERLGLPMTLAEGQRLDRAPCSLDADHGARPYLVAVEDRRIFAAG